MPFNKGLVFLSCTLVTWLSITTAGSVDPVLLPSPVAVWQAGYQLVAKNGIITDLATTARRVLISLGIAFVVGVPLGLVFGCQPKIYAWFEDTLHALRSIPATCLFPLLLIVIGVGEASIITLAAYPCLLIFVVNSASGAALTDKSRLHQIKALGANPFQIVSHLVYFEALPHITASLRTCVSYALVLVVAVEMFIGVGDNGIGRTIFDLQSNFLIPETYAAIIMTGVLGITLNFLVNRIEHYALRWLPRIEETQS